MKHVNVVLLRGECTGLIDDLMTLVIRPPNPRGGFYENEVPVLVDQIPKTRVRNIVGKRIELVGHLVNLERIEGEPNRSVFRPFKAHFKTTDDENDVNTAEIVGVTPSGVNLNSRKGMKQAFASVLMLADKTFVWGVAFKQYARALKDACPRGSLLKIGGRLSFREYEDEELGWRSVYEVIADGEAIKVLKKAALVDELADIRALGEIEMDEPEPDTGDTAPEGVV